ncbi:TenA family transcriptional regulator [Janthinobacterium sp. RT4P48]|jgi:pyrroloquinoline-quinone synthase|uniref:TenA family transcriptional regulator n=1 Tax=Janthinobacterium sp. RT4P48 TaxID=3424188 RepID=UPI003F27903A
MDLHANAGHSGVRPPLPVEDVIAQCNQIVHEKRYSRHQFVGSVQRGLPDRAALAAWALQKYHQVYTQNLIFSIIHSKTQFEDVRHFMIEQLVAEETGINCGSDSHYNLMRRFAEASGVGADQFGPATQAEPVRRYVDTLLGIMRDEHFAVGLLAIYAIESQSGESVGKMLATLREAYGYSEAELEWFTVHSDADDDHAEEGVRLVRKYAPQVAGFDQRALAVTERICDAWLQLHDYYASLLNRSAVR